MDRTKPIEKVLSRLEKYTERSGGFRTKCPAHNGNSDNSLSMTEGEDRRVLLTCHSGCGWEEVADALGLEPTDLFEGRENGGRHRTAASAVRPRASAATARPAEPAPKTKDKGKTVSTDNLPPGTYFDFTSPSGKLLYLQKHKGPYYRPAGEDLWKEGLGGREQVLYRLDDLTEGVRAGKTVYHFEGCKDAHTAKEKLGVVATTSGGTKTWKRSYREHYVGADVVVVGDNDAPGRAYVQQVAQDLHPVASSVKVVELPDLPEGGDLTDWLEVGHTKEEFCEVVAAAPYFDPEQEEPWDAPRELFTDLPPVAPFQAAMLPDPLGQYVVDAARRMDNASPEFIAAPLVVAAGSLIGRQVVVRPKAKDDWDCVPNLWGCNVGNPSSMKSPAQALGLAPISRLATEARKAFEAKEKEHAVAALEIKLTAADLEGQLKKAIKEGKTNDIQDIKEKLKALEGAGTPTVKRYMTSDSTIEMLGELLRDNPNGLLNDRDELSGWLSTLDRGGHEGDRAFFLEAWDGRKHFDVDRIGRGSIHVPALCLSIFGGIQPGPLMNYVRDALSESEKADGLLQRFQVLVWPDPRPYERSDEEPTPAAKEEVFKLFKELTEINIEDFGAVVEVAPRVENDDAQRDKAPGTSASLPYVRFTPAAQMVYDSWRDELEPRIREAGYPAALQSHLLKYRSLFPSLALIFEVLDHVAGKERPEGGISKTSALRAYAWCRWLEGHAFRLYHPAVIAPVLAAESLLERMRDGLVKHGDSLRDIHVRRWPGLTTKDEVQDAVEVLEAHGCVRLVERRSPSGGRPSMKLQLHPDLRDDEG
jgi:hypothetical protein